MPEDKTPDKPEVKPTKKTTESAEPYSKILAPNSPWKQLHSDGSIGTYVMEIRDAGVLVRTESPKENSESMVFLPNVKLSQLPDCK
jgi:hypothetical protein